MHVFINICYFLTFAHPHQPLCNTRAHNTQIICSHEHFVALNLPLQSKQAADRAASTLTASFCRRHFLVGLLLNECWDAVNSRDESTRHHAVRLLRGVLARLEDDPRYQAKEKRSRVTELFFPLIPMLMRLRPLYAGNNVFSQGDGANATNPNSEPKDAPPSPPQV